MELFYPVFVLIGWTLFCYARMGISRFNAAKKGEVDPRFYQLYQDGTEPEHLRLQTRHLRNLLEAPLIFYVVCLIAVQTDQTGQVVVITAWLYALLRLVHAFVHLRGNVVINRFKIFVLSQVALATLCVLVLVGMLLA